MWKIRVFFRLFRLDSFYKSLNLDRKFALAQFCRKLNSLSNGTKTIPIAVVLSNISELKYYVKIGYSQREPIIR